jgi:hypothetical protein
LNTRRGAPLLSGKTFEEANHKTSRKQRTVWDFNRSKVFAHPPDESPRLTDPNIHLADSHHLQVSFYINRNMLLWQIKTGFCQNNIYSELDSCKIKQRINYNFTVRIFFFPVHTIKSHGKKETTDPLKRRDTAKKL